MQKIFILLAALLFAGSARPQPPEKMSYQVVVRNNSNALIVTQPIGMRISILQGAANGTPVYLETQLPSTNANGLASIEIGGGTQVAGSFASIDWAHGPYFLKSEIDPAGGSNYTIVSVAQLLSVPYAQFSGNGILGVSATGDTLFLGNSSHIIIPGISAANNSQSPPGQHSCGADSVHNDVLTYGSMMDQDGNVYKTIAVGGQEWMAENLKTSHFSNGDQVPLVAASATWSGLTTSGACWYSDDSAVFSCPYGKLYNWFAASDPRNICPQGWHLPTDIEWSVLISQLDPNLNINANGSQSSIAGGPLKSVGNQYWLAPNVAADNSSGFSVLPTGFRDVNGLFYFHGEYGFFWSSTADASTNAWYRSVSNSFSDVFRNSGNRGAGFSVRCVRD